MTGTHIKLSAVHINNAEMVTFSVQSDVHDLPEVADASLGVQPEDQVFKDLRDMHSDPATPCDTVKEAGSALYDALNTHSNTGMALTQTLAAAAAVPTRQIRVEIPKQALAARNLPWEVLCDDQDAFLEINDGIPILRLIAPKHDATCPPGQLDGDRLRIVSVLGAQGIGGEPEWRAINHAVAKYDRPYSLLVFVCETALKDKIEALANADIEVRLVPATGGELMKDIGAFKPNICHFFCHGSADAGGFLEIANVATNLGGKPIYLTPVELGKTLPSSAWLVLLNACSGAQADPEMGSSSIAADLVEQGVPIVIGMRQKVSADTTSIFTKAFLGDALGRIKSLLAQNQQVQLDLGASLSTARNAICGNLQLPPGVAAIRTKEWSLPVMTVGTSDYFLSPASGLTALERSELMSERSTLQTMFHSLADNLTAAQVAKIETRIKELSQMLGGNGALLE